MAPLKGIDGTPPAAAEAPGELMPAAAAESPASADAAVAATAASAPAGPTPLDVSIGHLHTAFDTTLVALILSLTLMYFLHRVQARDDALLVRATDWCMQRFVFRMHIPQEVH
jgi:hypothetical protein